MMKLFVSFLVLVSLLHGGLQYSGAVPTVATDTPATRTALVDFIKNTLTTAGMSCAGSSGDWKCTTAANASATGQIKIRIWDPGSGNCARVGLLNVAESVDLTSEPAYILPAGTWTVIANKFHFVAWSDSTLNARHSIHAGTVYKPSFLTTMTTFGFMCGSGISDTDTALRQTFRNYGGCSSSEMHVIWNSTGWSVSVADTWSGNPLVMTQHGGGDISSRDHGRQWFDDSYMILDPLIKSDDVANGGDKSSRIVGQMWDMLFIPWKAFTEGTQITYDSKTWQAITNNNADGTFFIYVPTP